MGAGATADAVAPGPVQGSRRQMARISGPVGTPATTLLMTMREELDYRPNVVDYQYLPRLVSTSPFRISSGAYHWWGPASTSRASAT